MKVMVTSKCRWMMFYIDAVEVYIKIKASSQYLGLIFSCIQYLGLMYVTKVLPQRVNKSCFFTLIYSREIVSRGFRMSGKHRIRLHLLAGNGASEL